MLLAFYIFNDLQVVSISGRNLHQYEEYSPVSNLDNVRIIHQILKKLIHITLPSFMNILIYKLLK